MVASLRKRAAEKLNVSVIALRPDKVFTNQQRDQIRALQSLGDEGAYTFWHDNVHAKILIVDNKYALVTSMNLQPKSMMTNKEVGILTSDAKVIEDLNQFVEDLKPRG